MVTGKYSSLCNFSLSFPCLFLLGLKKADYVTLFNAISYICLSFSPNCNPTTKQLTCCDLPQEVLTNISHNFAKFLNFSVVLLIVEEKENCNEGCGTGGSIMASIYLPSEEIFHHLWPKYRGKGGRKNFKFHLLNPAWTLDMDLIIKFPPSMFMHFTLNISGNLLQISQLC